MKLKLAQLLSEINCGIPQEKICVSAIKKIGQNIFIELYSVREKYSVIYDIVFFEIYHDLSRYFEMENPQFAVFAENISFKLENKTKIFSRFFLNGSEFKVYSRKFAINIQKIPTI